MDYQIGDKVKWKAGKIQCTGVVLDDIDNEKVAVIVHTIDKRFSGSEREVYKDILELDINC